jgi:hypothetical protein
MAAVSQLAGSVTNPATALLMASTVGAIIGPATGASGGASTTNQLSTLGIEVQTKAIDISQVSPPSLTQRCHQSALHEVQTKAINISQVSPPSLAQRHRHRSALRPRH